MCQKQNNVCFKVGWVSRSKTYDKLLRGVILNKYQRYLNKRVKEVGSVFGGSYYIQRKCIRKECKRVSLKELVNYYMFPVGFLDEE